MFCKHCGKEIDDKAVLCVHCGKMIKELPKTVNKKSKSPTGLIVFLWIAFLPIMAIVTIVKSQKFSKTTKLILSIVIIIATILVGIIGAISAANIEKANYETIITAVENRNFEEAQDLIDNFIRDYPNSKHIDEIKKQKETVDTEIAKREAEKKAKKEQEILNAQKAENAKKAGISVEALENMVKACKTIDIDFENISNITAKNDWANGKRCSFNFNGYSFLVYFNQDGTVNSINSGNIKFYENGKKVEDFKNRLITTEEKSRIKTWAEENVKEILKAPSTAKFPGSFLSPFKDWNISKDGNKFTVSSYVDSQNGFGAMIRSDFTITYEWKDGTGKVVSMIFDGKKVV